jgi:hypothetical protein
MNAQIKALLASYGRSVLGAGLALYLAGVPLEDLVYSLLAALVPVALRYVNPSDPAFGRKLPPVEEVAEALSKVKVVKAPVKAPATNKVAEAIKSKAATAKPAEKKTTPKK